MPYDDRTIRSVYHIREYDVARLLQLKGRGASPDVFMSHDWPLGIEQHGETDALIREKPFFREEVRCLFSISRVPTEPCDDRSGATRSVHHHSMLSFWASNLPSGSLPTSTSSLPRSSTTRARKPSLSVAAVVDDSHPLPPLHPSSRTRTRSCS